MSERSCTCSIPLEPPSWASSTARTARSTSPGTTWSLLQGLLDRPDATALGRWDWVRAARPYIRRYRGDTESNWILYHAIGWLPTCWVERKRRGRYMSYRLLERGRKIVEGRVCIKVSGRYDYLPKGAV